MDRERKTYDHRLRDLVCRTGNLGLGVRLAVERVRMNREKSCDECLAREGPAELLAGEAT
jgi:hypothetical protein